MRITVNGGNDRRLREVSNVRALGRMFRVIENRSDLTWLGTIDAYGETIFNRLQIPKLLEEWEVLSAETATDEERRAMDEVRSLAEYCLERPHRYLVFSGD